MKESIRQLTEDEIAPSLFDRFERRQLVNKVFRKQDGNWVIKEHPFVDDWNSEDYLFLTQCLKNTIRCGGAVFGCFIDDALLGFASVEGEPFGSNLEYLDLTSLHVSRGLRRRGIGLKLFVKAAEFAAAHGAGKLYISSHSAVETQAFYRSLGCTDALEINARHAEKEPFDCQLEFDLKKLCSLYDRLRAD